jgi:hypothetical protein
MMPRASAANRRRRSVRARIAVRRIGRSMGRQARRAVRRGRMPALLVLLLLSVSALLGGGAYAASTLYGQFGSPRTSQSEIAWAERPETYLASDCRGCHGDAAAQAAGTPHRELLCETCHVPSVDHPGPVSGVTRMLPAATSEQCIACHASTVGRPQGFAQVPIDSHFVGADCIACHEPHSSDAVAPKAVTHPLDRLPECTVCHGPVGLKQFPANHEPAPDATCLACHRPGAAGMALP